MPLKRNWHDDDMRFQCHACEAVLTREVLDTPTEPCEKDGQDLVPEGVALRFCSWSDGQWVINAKDNLSMQLTRDSERLSGCCDVSGCDGPNLVCGTCGAEVATARYDCWMPRHIVMVDERIEVVG